MCVYCATGDEFFQSPRPPFIPNPWPPQIPAPIIVQPYQPWPLDRVKDLLDVLERLKALEDKLGCPCEPNKADYLTLLSERIAVLEAKVKEQTNDTDNPPTDI